MAIHRLLILALAALPFLGTQAFAQDAGQYRTWDRNNDGVITRAEWRGSLQEFRERDWNSDGVLSGREVWEDEWERSEVSESVEFNSLDRNRNGRISRGEWRGTRATFREVDRNGDNQITRDEFLYQSARAVTRPISFDALDLDYSERIERNEWRGTRPAFNRLDLNGDGVLTRRELNAGDVARASMEERDAAVEQTIVVDPRQPWTHTGIHVNAGDVVTYRATGTIQMSIGGDDRATPAGAISGRTATQSPRPDRPAGSLLLRIGNGAVEVIGDNGSFTARQSGQLSFGVNDDHLADNSGEYRVRLAITPR